MCNTLKDKPPFLKLDDVGDEERVELIIKSNGLLKFWYDLEKMIVSSPGGHMFRAMAEVELVCEASPPATDTEEYKVWREREREGEGERERERERDLTCTM